MRRQALVVVLLAVTACPPPAGEDAGSGGGAAAGGGGAGATGGGTATGGGVATGGGGATGGGAGSGGGVADAGITLSTLCAARSAAQCRWYERCGFPYYTGTEADCEAQQTSACERYELPRARAGALRFDAGAAQRCVDSYANAPCNENFPAYAACNPVFTPNATVGQLCQFGDCTEGYCPGSTFTSQVPACARCQPFATLGQNCKPAAGILVIGCEPGTRCQYETDGGGWCVVRSADGQVCSGDGECSSLYCRQFYDVDGGPARCGQVPLGGTCGRHEDCGAGRYCSGLLRFDDPGVGVHVGAEGTCAPRIALDAGCTNHQLDDGCVEFASCLDGVCQSTWSRTVGQSCDRGFQCANESVCVREDEYLPDGGAGGSDGVCVARLDAGQACESGLAPCARGLWCSDDGGCATPLPEGSECDYGHYGQCGTGNACMAVSDGGLRCTGPAPAWGECAVGQACLGGQFCFSNADSGTFFRCTAVTANGTACTSGGTCTSARCAPIVDGGAQQCVPACFP